MSYNPNGISFKKLQKNVIKGNQYYIVKYYTDLVCDKSEIKRIEYLKKSDALKAFDKLNLVKRAHTVTEVEFKANEWQEHVELLTVDDYENIIEEGQPY